MRTKCPQNKHKISESNSNEKNETANIFQIFEFERSVMTKMVEFVAE